MIDCKPPFKQAAFTLLELIIVLVVLSILATYIQTRPSSSDDYRQDTVAEQIIAAGRLAQQLSMNDSARVFSLDIQASQVDLLADGVSLAAGSLDFPISFGNQITLSPVSNIIFDSLGATSATTINVQAGGSQQVCFESSGYIHRC